MKNYHDLIEQSFDFPNKEFGVKDNQLQFNEVNLMDIIKEHGTPLKLTYLPKISDQIKAAKEYFNKAIAKKNYSGSYTYCYCTKSNHFQFVLEEALKNDIHLETSSTYDISIVEQLYDKGLLTKDTFIICNGFKRPFYLERITDLLNAGFKNCMPILDNLNELEYFDQHAEASFNFGIRLAADEEPNFEFYTSRLGIRYDDVLPYYQEKIKGKSKGQLKMLHYFINSGIKDTAYYWNELSRFVKKYCELKKVCPSLEAMDIGGGFPIKNSLAFEYDYEYMAEQIIENIQAICDKEGVTCPNIFTEFGSFTVAESGATIYSVLDQKLQNDNELWYMMDGSFITHLPDVWGISSKFIMLPINLWENEFQKVNIGGLTCDSMDYYNSESHASKVFLPVINKNESMYFGFFHTGAYQEALGGYGGIQHCLIPAPKHILIDLDSEGNVQSRVFSEEQTSESMMKLLGF